ncbi:hypothetical protein KCA24_32605, partial [Escherichia coli]|nr:hypothetical protein [Escherichia coli]
IPSFFFKKNGVPKKGNLKKESKGKLRAKASQIQPMLPWVRKIKFRLKAFPFGVGSSQPKPVNWQRSNCC